MKLGTRTGFEAQINVTPMIDVLLVLLVIFMLSVRVRMILPMNVPPPPASSRGDARPHVVLELRADGAYVINSAVVARPDLRARLQELYEDGGRGVLFVRAAPRRRYGEVIEAVDIARGAGVPVVAYMP